MAISLRLSKKEEELFKNFAKAKNITVSALIREAVTNQIENEYDLVSFNQALEKYKEDSSLTELERLYK